MCRVVLASGGERLFGSCLLLRLRVCASSAVGVPVRYAERNIQRQLKSQRVKLPESWEREFAEQAAAAPPQTSTGEVSHP